MKSTFFNLKIKELLDSFSESKKIIVAYSGGIDSSALLHLLNSIKNELKQSIEVIYINHGLHKKSLDWGKFCEDECNEYNIPFKLISINEKCPNGVSIESWARNKRYSIISKEMNKNDILLTGHHMDDQVETFFLQILRGSGPRGLSCMPAIKKFKNGFHVRPFLNIQRNELEEYINANNINWQEDESNSDTRYDRNYLRHSVLPYFGVAWPSYCQSISKSINHQIESMTILNEIALEDMEKTLCKNLINLNVIILKRLSVARQKNLIFYWRDSLNLDKPGSKHMEQIISTLINSGYDKCPCVNWKNTEIRKYRDHLYAFKSIHEHDENIEINWNTKSPLKIQGETLVAKESHGKGVSKSIIEDARITIRYRHGGEKIYTNSSSHSKTVKQLFQESGVLPWLRDRIPLIYINEELAVIPGFCVGKKYSASKDEKSLDIYWSGYTKVIQ